MEIIGHRGAKGLAPENTILALKKGMQAKATMLEIDVRVKEEDLVLSHDEVDEDTTYTLLEDALTVVDGIIPLNLEIKELGVVALLPKVLEGYDGDVLFSSFEYKILQEIKKTIPNASIAVLENWSGVRAIAEASLLGTKRVHINQQWLWSGFVKSMKHKGFLLYAYTVNSSDRADELEKWGVDGIFTDYPTLFT